jgi:hypothetical protein
MDGIFEPLLNDFTYLGNSKKSGTSDNNMLMLRAVVNTETLYENW